MATKGKITFLSIRIPPDLKRAVERAAKKDDRSTSSFVIRALRAAVGGE